MVNKDLSADEMQRQLEESDRKDVEITKTFDLTAYADSTTETQERTHPVLGKIRFCYLTTEETEPLNLNEFSGKLQNLAEQLRQTKLCLDKLKTDKKEGTAQAASAQKSYEEALDLYQVAVSNVSDLNMDKVVFAMLKKASPTYTEAVWKKTPVNIKALLREFFLEEITRFLFHPQNNGST